MVLLYRAFMVAVLGFSSIAYGGESVSQLSAADAHAKAQAGDIKLIDIREPVEWRRTGVAQNASLIRMRHPQGMHGFAQAVYLAGGEDLEAPIVLICRTGSRSGRMALQLKQMGFENVSHVPEGMLGSRAGPGWIAKGLPIQAVD